MSKETNPVEDYFESKEAAQTKRKKDELDMWHRWQQGGQQPQHLEPLLKAYEPVFGQHMKKKPPMIQPSVYKAELQTRAIKAFETFDPTRGAALNTHVDWHLRKALRYGGRHANIAYLPEGQAQFIGPINKARDTLTEELGREPTPQEIHNYLQDDPDKDFRKLTPKRIETIQAGAMRDIPRSRSAGAASGRYDYSRGAGGASGHDFEEQQIAVAQNILPTIFPNNPAMHTLFNYTFGTNDHPQVTSTGQLSKLMGKSQSQISRMKTQMGTTLKKHMGLDDED